MRARYVFRLDDITPTMDWGRFWGLMALFRRSKVRPLLGIVPDNLDQALVRQRPRRDFWQTLRQLRDEGLVDVAQHGYQHTLSFRPGLQLIGRAFGIKEFSEFAGDSYSSQLCRIDEGYKILDSHGLATPYFMAPNHSFDVNTLRALAACGFRAITDGVSLFPVCMHGIICVPQQLWRPRVLPFGSITICLHTNDMGPRAVAQVREFLRRPLRFSSFAAEASGASSSLATKVGNASFMLAYAGARGLRGLLRDPRPGPAGAGHPENSQLSC